MTPDRRIEYDAKQPTRLADEEAEVEEPGAADDGALARATAAVEKDGDMGGSEVQGSDDDLDSTR